jgi:hypothetical protein
MTTLDQNQNPFSSQDSQDANSSDDFNIRTMQTDLINLSSGNIPGSEKNSTIKNISNSNISSDNKSLRDASPFSSLPPTENLTTNNAFVRQNQNNTNIPPAIKSTPQSSANFPEKSILTSKNIPPQELASGKKENPLTNIIFVTIIVIIILSIGVGGYYFFITRSGQVEQQAAPIIEEPVAQIPVVEEPVVITAPIEKYSSLKPNYLPIDIAKAKDTDITKSLMDIVPELGVSASETPLEFLVVDINNNPITFSIFSSALKLNLSPATLSALSENFSIYYYKDGSSVKLGLSIDIKDPIGLKTSLQKEESNLPSKLLPLFLGATPEIKNGKFKDSIYNNAAIRYLNLNSQNTLSVDYAVGDKQLAIGTSKDTLRKIIDKLSLPKNVTPSNNIKSTTEPATNLTTPVSQPTTQTVPSNNSN